MSNYPSRDLDGWQRYPIVCEPCRHECPPANAVLAATQIENHGKDRYPTPEMQMIKIMEEVGELAKEINKGNVDKARLESADVALALYNLANKLQFDLDSAIHEVVTKDKRSFKDETPKP